MLDPLVFGAGVVVAPGVRLVLVRLRRGRWREPPMPNEYLPPPAGHQAVAADGCTLKCSCGWWHSVPWPPTSRRLNRARGNHCFAVEQQRLAERLGVDAESMLARVVTARGVAQQAEQAAGREPGEGAAQVEAGRQGPRRLAPGRNARNAAEARRASAIARVESERVLPKYTSGDG